MHKIRLIALDLDGTLLNSDKELTTENSEALEKAAEAGIEIVPATGRFYRGMPKVIRDLPYVNYVITVNGALVYDIRQDHTVFAGEIPADRAVEVMNRLDTLPVIYDCFQNGWGWMTKSLYDQAEQYISNPHTLEMVQTLRTPVPDLKELLLQRGTGVQKIQMFFRDMELREEMLKKLPGEFPDLLVTSSIVNNIEFNSRKSNKGNALQALAASLGIPMQETMAFGDDLNDITMLQDAGIGVAMGNAWEEVKKASDYVTDTCDHSGVAQAMNLFLWRN